MRPAFALLALAAFAGAQEKKEAVPAAPIIAPEAKAAPDESAEYAELVDAYNKAQKEFYDAWRKASAENPKAPLDQSKHPRNEYVGKFEEFARRAAGTKSAVSAWVMFLRCGGKPDTAKEVLLREYIDSPDLVNALYSFSYGEENAPVLAEFAAKSPHRAVKGVAYLLTGQNLLRSGKDDEAARYLVMCQWKYADVPLYNGRTTVGKKAESSLFEARNLAVGQPVPDIEGEDVDGVSFKLSGYRGKVILLDFWGDW